MASVTDIKLEELRSYWASAVTKNPSFNDAVTLLDLIIDRDSDEDATVESIRADISALAAITSANTKELLRINNLLALLLFELIEHGIEIQNKELLTELKLYLYGNRR